MVEPVIKLFKTFEFFHSDNDHHGPPVLLDSDRPRASCINE